MPWIVVLCVLLVAAPVDAEGYRVGGGVEGTIAGMLDVMERRRKQQDADADSQRELLLMLIQSGQLVMAQPGDPVDFYYAGVPLRHAIRQVNKAASDKHVCPVGGEVYPTNVNFCPTHGVRVQRR